jgi:hypothetical protein
MKYSLVFLLLPFTLCAQNVGVNVLNPSATLDVHALSLSPTDKALSISNAFNDTLLILNNNGFLGLGTTQPNAPLTIQTNAPIAAFFSSPVEGQPAVNPNELVTLGQLQAVSASSSANASSQSSATMWSLGFTTQNAYISNGAIFCRNLNEGGFTDWRLPTAADIMKLVQDPLVPLPTYNSGGYWLSPGLHVNGASSAWPIFFISNSNLSASNSFYFTTDWGASSYRAFCVR